METVQQMHEEEVSHIHNRLDKKRRRSPDEDDDITFILEQRKINQYTNIHIKFSKKKSIILHEIEWTNNGFLFTTPNIYKINKLYIYIYIYIYIY